MIVAYIVSILVDKETTDDHRVRQSLQRQCSNYSSCTILCSRGFSAPPCKSKMPWIAYPRIRRSRPSLNRAVLLMQRAIDEGREVLEGLHSSGVASMSLEQTLSGLREEFTPSGGVGFRIFVKGQPKALNPVVQEQISLIGREALANSLRHSKAISIEAEVEYLPRRVRVVVRDNGCGIDPQMVQTGRKAHWGLVGNARASRKYRRATPDLEQTWAGTEVEVSIPDNFVAAACA